MKEKSKFRKFLPLILIVGIFVVAVLVGGFTRDDGFKFDIGLITNTVTIVILAVGYGLLILYWLSKVFKSDGKPSASGMGTTKTGEKISQYYDARFIKESELNTEKRFNHCTWSGLSKLKKDGIVIRSQVKGSTLDVNLYDPIHTMIIGTTGSGKTQTYINPSIQILSQIGSKPCLVMTDPKVYKK